MKTIEELLDEVQTLGAAREAALYAILVRNAGWAVEWCEVGRCTTPPPARSPVPIRELPIRGLVDALRRSNEAMAARAKESVVVYAYRPTLREALEFELARLKTSPVP